MLDENTHTPGPWILGGCSGRMVHPLSKKGLDYWIADVDVMANARLIAAAPDFWSAHDRLREDVLHHPEWDNDRINEVLGMIDDIFAPAIAKATGVDQ